MKKQTNTRMLIVILILLILLLIGVIVAAVLAGKKSSPTRSADASVTTRPDLTPVPVSTPDDSTQKESAVQKNEPETPTDTPKPTPTKVPENGYKIAIDAGHQTEEDSETEPIGPGSSTTKAKVSSGTRGSSSGVAEYELNLTIAKKLKKELKKRGYKVYMVRTKNDVRISNKERAEAVNDSGSDVCVRLHADGVDDSSVRGVSCLYPTPDNPFVPQLSKASRKLSKLILNAYCDKTGLSNRGLSGRDDLTGTNWSEIPVALLEMGFMSNPTEDELMQDPDFQRDMAAGIADGIDRYFNL